MLRRSYRPLALSCLVALSRLLSSLLFSFRSRSPSLLFPLFVFFQAGHALAHSRACRKKRIKNLGFFHAFLRELAANWVLYRLRCHGVILGNGSYTTSL